MDKRRKNKWSTPFSTLGEGHIFRCACLKREWDVRKESSSQTTFCQFKLFLFLFLALEFRLLWPPTVHWNCSKRCIWRRKCNSTDTANWNCSDMCRYKKSDNSATTTTYPGPLLLYLPLSSLPLLRLPLLPLPALLHTLCPRPNTKHLHRKWGNSMILRKNCVKWIYFLNMKK